MSASEKEALAKQVFTFRGETSTEPNIAISYVRCEAAGFWRDKSASEKEALAKQLGIKYFFTLNITLLDLPYKPILIE